MNPVSMIALDYVTRLGYCSIGGRVLAKSCNLMSSNQAVAGVALYFFMNYEFVTSNGRNLTLPRFFADLISPNYREDPHPYSYVKSRIITLAIAYKVLALKPSEVLALFMISEIIIGIYERDDFFNTDRQQKKACAGILINMGASYLLAKKFSMMNPGSAATEALLISLVQLLFSRRISQISREVYIDGRISWFGYKLFRVLDKLALPVSILIYSANAYSRGISPINIASLLSITTIGTQLLNRD